MIDMKRKKTNQIKIYFESEAPTFPNLDKKLVQKLASTWTRKATNTKNWRLNL